MHEPMSLKYEPASEPLQAPKEKAGPKKPLSSYMIFSSETRPSVQSLYFIILLI